MRFTALLRTAKPDSWITEPGQLDDSEAASSMEREDQAAERLLAGADAEWFFFRKRSRREGAKTAPISAGS
jgi:hypothetical protein